jgi:hypothetical protein
MIETLLPAAPDVAVPVSASDSGPLLLQLLKLRRENAALRAQNAAVQQRIRELEAWLGQNSANSSRPPSPDLPLGLAIEMIGADHLFLASDFPHETDDDSFIEHLEEWRTLTGLSETDHRKILSETARQAYSLPAVTVAAS